MALREVQRRPSLRCQGLPLRPGHGRLAPPGFSLIVTDFGLVLATGGATLPRRPPRWQTANSLPCLPLASTLPTRPGGVGATHPRTPTTPLFTRGAPGRRTSDAVQGCWAKQFRPFRHLIVALPTTASPPSGTSSEFPSCCPREGAAVSPHRERGARGGRRSALLPPGWPYPSRSGSGRLPGPLISRSRCQTCSRPC